MGVPGLTTFLNDNHHLLTNVALHDTRIVVDGNNLYHFLYDLYKMPAVYGGDYDHFFSAVSAFFKIFQSCNIDPVVVMDGPYDPNDTKINTSLIRAKERIRHAQNAGNTSLAPIFAQYVFIAALEDLGVDVVTCDAEADMETAALANRLGCPVLTNDSDFFIFDIQSGVILLDNLNMQTRKSYNFSRAENVSELCIDVQLYHYRKLIPFMDPQLLPLLGTVMGNDRVDIKLFEAFLKSDHLPKGSKIRTVMDVLSWLESCSDLSTAINKILSCFSQQKRPKIAKIINDSVRYYTSTGTSQTFPYLEQKWNNKQAEQKDCHSLADESPLLSAINSVPFPTWFMREFRQGKLTGVLTNTAISHQVILLPQPESFTKASSYKGSLSLRQLAYGIVSSRNAQDGKNQNRITEVDRELSNQKWNCVEPLKHLAGKELPGLPTVESLSKEERLSIYSEGLNINSEVLMSWPKDLQLYMTTMVYWINESEPQINWLHLASVVLCIIKLSIIDRVSQTDSRETKDCGQVPDIDVTLRNMQHDGFCSVAQSACQIEIMMRLKEKFTKIGKQSKSKNPSAQLDCSAAHAFCQLQACLLSAVTLNQTLAMPLPLPQIHLLFSGSFLHSIYRELWSRLKPELYIPELLEKSEHMTKIYSYLFDAVKYACCSDALITDLSPGNKRSKKAAAKKSTKQSGKSTDSLDDATDSKRKKASLADNSPELINNRFGCLVLTDDE